MLAFYIFEIICVLLYMYIAFEKTIYNSARTKLTPSIIVFSTERITARKIATEDQRVYYLKN